MKQEFVELLRCPRCWAHLELTTFVETTGGDEIIDGVLRCGCGASYPIVDAIPRVLMGAYSQFPAFVERYRSLLNDISEETERPTGRFERMQAETLTDIRGCHLIESAGHWVQQEQPTAVAKALIDFLDGVELSR